MTTDKIRERAVQILAARDKGKRVPASIVVLKDGSSLTGVLTEHAKDAGNAGVAERLGFTLSDDEVRYFSIDDIFSL
jgi:hypothetical protein